MMLYSIDILMSLRGKPSSGYLCTNGTYLKQNTPGVVLQPMREYFMGIAKNGLLHSNKFWEPDHKGHISEGILQMDSDDKHT